MQPPDMDRQDWDLVEEILERELAQISSPDEWEYGASVFKLFKKVSAYCTELFDAQVRPLDPDEPDRTEAQAIYEDEK